MPETGESRIALLGAGGQLGHDLAKEFATLGLLYTFRRDELDLEDFGAIHKTLGSLRPDIIVNAAAYTAVDRAESEESKAKAVNGIAPGVIAECAAGLNALLIHYSTDFVFDGRSTMPYTEESATVPLSVYGRTKLAGEKNVINSRARYLILRTSWVYGVHGRNFVKTILRLGQGKSGLQVVDDQIGSPTSARLITKATRHAINSVKESQADRSGLYHLSARGEVSWYEFAKTILFYAQEMGFQLRAGPEDVKPIVSSDYPQIAARPAYSVLSARKFEQTFGMTLPDWQTELIDTLQMIHSNQDGTN